MADWYYAIKRSKMGPVSEAEVKRLVAEGTLAPSDLVWTNTMADWTRADRVLELFPDDFPRRRERPIRWDEDLSRPRLRKVIGSGNLIVVLLCVFGGLGALVAGVVIFGVLAFLDQPLAIPRPDQQTSADAIPIPLTEMQRIWTGRLTPADPVDEDAPDHFCKVFTFPMVAERTYIIDMESTAFAAFLRLEEPDGEPLLDHDQRGGVQNARLSYTPHRAGLYRIIATTSQEGATGDFVLKIRPVNEPAPNLVPPIPIPEE